jgi:hypothetical protein
MRGLESRLKRLEQQIPPPRSPGERPPWRTPEQHAERERRFEELYRELGLPWPTAPSVRGAGYQRRLANAGAGRSG